MRIDGLVTYFLILVNPRNAFERLKSMPTWGWAVVGGLVLTLVALLVAEPAQLHVLALSESHRIAALPPGERIRTQMAEAQIAGNVKSLLIVGALTTPWITWFLMALFFLMSAAISRGRPSFGMAWVIALNSYAVYGVGAVINAILLSVPDPNTFRSALDLVAVPSPGWLFPHNPPLAAFLSAYNPIDLWYYAVVALALVRVLNVPRGAAWTAAFGYSLLFGFFAAAAVGSQP